MNRRNINEALGVPENIIQSAIKLYDYIVGYLSSLDDINSDDKYNIQIIGDFRISDMNLKNINLTIELHKYNIDNFVLISMGQASERVINSMFQVEAILKPNETDLMIDLATPTTFDDEELVNFFKNNKKYLVPILAHELKHGYDIFKKPKANLLKKIEYNVYSDSNFGGLKPLSRFLFNSYYIHNIENLVRPTELAAHIQLDEVTPEQFKDYFLGNKIYQTLKEIKNFSYEELRNKLMEYEIEMDDLLNHIGESYDTLQEKVDRILELFYINITNWKNEKILKYIYPTGIDNPLFIFLKTPEKDNYLNYFFNKTEKYKKDYLSFYKNEERFQRTTAFNMIKKLAKLYEMTYQNITEPRKPKPMLPENKSIWNWELYKKIKGEKKSIGKKIKTKDELISEMVNRLKNKFKK